VNYLKWLSVDRLMAEDCSFYIDAKLSAMKDSDKVLSGVLGFLRDLFDN
jgi:hypothetical protein